MAKDVINMAQVDRCFPAAEAAPITVREAIIGIASDWSGDIRRYAIGKEGETLKPGNKSGKYLNLIRPSLDKPCPTLTKGAGEWPSGASVTHPIECRKFSIAEQRRIASFPGQFSFDGDWGKATSRIGNSVPPMMMRAIAGQIAEVMFGKTTWRPDRRMDYPAILEEAWTQHLAPREPDAPTVISTFAGCGGSSLGYSMAGYRELLAVEWDDNAVATFKLNFPGVPVYHGDIAKLSVEECMALAGLSGPGELDVLEGSPPCQGFSTAGKRNMDDDRNQLFREFVRLLRGLRPKVFLMENVSGLVKGKMKLIFAEIMRELKASGYRVSCRLMNAMYFHVPQSRQRLIFIGVRDDLGIEPGHPIAQSRPRVIGNMLSDLETMEQNDVTSHIWQKNSAVDMERIARVNEGGKLSDLGYSFNSAYRRISRREVSPTITKGGSIGISTSGSSWYSHYCLDRPLSVREGARIASFPDRFAFIGDAYAGCCRIGNSVPPLMMRSIARHIRCLLDAKDPAALTPPGADGASC